MNCPIETALQSYPPDETGNYQVLGWMPAPEFEILLRSIHAQQQVQVPIIQDSEGNILDGHHRHLGHKLLKIKEPLKVQTLGNMSEEEKRRYALSTNLVRRQITRKERREIIAAELRRDPEMSNTELAEVCGTTKKTVRSVREELVEKGEIPQIERTRRRNGGTYPLPQIVTTDKRSANRAQVAMHRLGDDAPSRSMTVQNAEWRVRKKKRAERAAAPLPKSLPDEIQIQHIDFRDLALDDESVDLILTDPPYARDALPLWADMAKPAARVLKPGGHLVTYSGVAHLPEVLSSISGTLEYVWTICINLGQGQRLIDRTKSRTAWRPVLVFCKGRHDPAKSFVDVYYGSAQEKDDHDWQQSLDEALRFVDKFSDPGDIIYDPFGGSFTNAIASFQLGRRFVGCDAEEVNVRIGKQRLAEAMASHVSGEDRRSA